MKLKKLILKNFRGYKHIEIFFDDNFNVIVGKNDIGKSTIMESLNIFFNPNNAKVDVNDLNVFSDEKYFSIDCCFELNNNNENIVLDSTYSTNLKDEYLLNDKGLLQISMEWHCEENKILSTKKYIICQYPKEIKDPLLNLKITDLKNLIKTESFYESIDKTKSADIRTAYYKNCLKKPDEVSIKKIDILKNEGRNVYENIIKYFPLYFLFQSDRENKDSDTEVQNPLKIETKKILRDIDEKLEEIKNFVKTNVEEISNNTINYLKEFDENISKNLKTDLNTKSWDSIFSFSLIDDKNIPLNKRGSGVRRLVLLSYFMAEAEKAKDNRNIIYAFEEPENSQHPDYQKKMIESFLKLSEKKSYQIILTTHNPHITKMAKPSQLIFLKRDHEGNPMLILEEEEKINNIINTLGIFPEITSNIVICVEGENDKKFLKNINKNISEFNKIIDLEKFEIIPLNGSNLINWVNNNYLKKVNIKEFHIYDNDRDDYKTKINQINAEGGKRRAIHTHKLQMENYINPELINKEFNKEICYCSKGNCIECFSWDNCNFLEKIYEKSGLKLNIFKDILNGKVSKEIKEKDLNKINAYDEVKSWFEEIKKFYEE